MTSSLIGGLALVALAAFILSGRAIPIPEAMTNRVEAAVNERLPAGRVDIGTAALAIGQNAQPRIRLKNVRIDDSGGGRLASLNQVEADLSLGALLQGNFSANKVRLSGAQITVRRSADGRFGFEGAGVTSERSVAEGLALLDQAIHGGALGAVGEVEADGVVITLEDARTGRIWQATDAQVALRERADGLSLSVGSEVFNGTENLSRVQLSFSFDSDSRDLALGVQVEDMPAADIALQSPALAWLGVLDAPISGSVRAAIDGAGALETLDGALDIGRGALRPLEALEPVGFDAAEAYFTFDPGENRIDFAEVRVESEVLRLTGFGRAYLSEFDQGWPGAYLGQFEVPEAVVAASGVFEDTLALTGLNADFRLRLDPFTVDVAQVSLSEESAEIRGSGRVVAAEDGWRVALNAGTDAIAPERVLAFWPVRAAPITRGWLSRNVLSGSIRDVSVSGRLGPGRNRDISLSFDFTDGTVKVLRHMPPIAAAAGRATMHDRQFTIVLSEGELKAADGGVVDIARSVFHVPDTEAAPSRGEIAMSAGGPLGSALEILNRRPLRLMERAGRTPEIAEGVADVLAWISLPLKDGIQREDVGYEVEGVLRDLSSGRIVENRLLTSDALAIRGSPAEISLEGPAALDGVPLTARWTQPLGPDADETGGSITGRIALGPETVEAFDLPLPTGFVQGGGWGDYALALSPGAPPRLSLASDLAGVGLSIDGLGWSKSLSSQGALEIDADLGAVPSVDRLSLTAPGLTLDGALAFSDGGAFSRAEFTRVRLGGWLDARAVLTPSEPGQSPDVALTGGTVDLRELEDIAGGNGSSRPIDVDLDTVVVSDGIRLAPFSGRLTPGNGGLDGRFQARLNGQTPIEGRLTPVFGGTGVRMQAVDAGGVARDAGLTPNARGGTLDLVMTPVRGAPIGTYDGEFLVEGVRMRGAPALADLLDAISVVGLIDQLSGPGIRFETVDGRFRLASDRLVLQEAAAVGGSLGISAEGVYDLATKEMDMQGVISPVYFVNAIGSILTRRGEGLFGFNFRMTGPASAPSIAINPLSIFTPGMFREIFRRPVPTE
ncbi:MAG: AsmA-like C-terminal region-containing protein [Paracoccaceae bacterium]|nr:AsmA-like C-terminal region-containing protein [Paracoccaceae bacterium]